MSNVCVYITAGSADEAWAIGRALVEERLAAAVNVIGAIRSIYRWNGAVHEADETVLIAKTRADLVEALTERVKALHSYACPCVMALPVTAGHAGYLQWIGEETRRTG